MPELMDIKQTNLGSKICVEISNFDGAYWEFLDDWITHSKLVKIGGEYYSLGEGIRLGIIHDLNWVDELTGRTYQDWKDALRSIQTAPGWDAVNAILNSPEVQMRPNHA